MLDDTFLERMPLWARTEREEATAASADLSTWVVNPARPIAFVAGERWEMVVSRVNDRRFRTGGESIGSGPAREIGEGDPVTAKSVHRP